MKDWGVFYVSHANDVPANSKYFFRNKSPFCNKFLFYWHYNRFCLYSSHFPFSEIVRIFLCIQQSTGIKNLKCHRNNYWVVFWNRFHIFLSFCNCIIFLLLSCYFNSICFSVMDYRPTGRLNYRIFICYLKFPISQTKRFFLIPNFRIFLWTMNNISFIRPKSFRVSFRLMRSETWKLEKSF